MALHQTMGFAESLLQLVGPDSTVPDFSTLCRCQKTLAVNIPYRGSKGPMHLPIDSTDIKVEGEGEWHARKRGGSKLPVWRKIHLGIDEETLEIRAVEITMSHIGDAPMLPDLLSQILSREEIGSVTADGAFDTRKSHDAIADRGAHTIIPPRRNAKPWKAVTAGAVARNEALRASKCGGRGLRPDPPHPDAARMVSLHREPSGSRRRFPRRRPSPHPFRAQPRHPRQNRGPCVTVLTRG